MKIFLLIIFACCVSYTDAKNYYFSNSSGNDLRTPAEAQNINTPWKTLDKLNSFFDNLTGGDSLLLKRGEVFYGSINISKSGSLNSPIVIAAYGHGSLPVISGFITLSGWNPAQKGTYEYSETLNDTVLNMLTINDAEYEMGRYPNANAAGKGWLAISSHLNNNSITDASLPSNPDWTGGEMVIRKKHFIIDRNKIISHIGNTLNYLSGSQYVPTNGFGYFIQNHMAALDKFGEWFYNPQSKKLNIYFGTQTPSAYKLKASNISTLISVRNQRNIVFNNLSLEGSNMKGFHLYYAQNINIKNCVIAFSGEDAIDGFNTKNILIENCTITNSNNNALDFIGACNNTQVRNNIIKNTGIYAGMASSRGHSFSGINITGDNNLVEYNEIDSSGYVGIRFDGSSTRIRNNFINSFCFIKDDGGGIYTGNNNAGNIRNDQVIEGNIILNGIGVRDGTTDTNLQAYGIYLDDNSANIRVTGNTVAYASRAGILLHNSHDNIVINNTCYGNSTQLIVQKDAASNGQVRNNTISNNVLFSKNASQFSASFLTNANDINLFGKIDSNYYSRPIDDNVTITTSYVDNKLGKINKFYDLRAWASKYNKDRTSKKSPIEINDYKFKSLGSLNKFPNGNLDNTISEVKGFKCKVEWQHSGSLDGGYLQVTSLPDVSASYITIPVGIIHSGKKYILRFTAKGAEDDDKTISVLLRENGSPYANLAQTIYRNISTKRRDFEVAFSATKDESNALLAFALYDPNTTYWLDNIQLYEADAIITKPEDHFIFEYNASKENKKFNLNGNYVDLSNKSYSESITLRPYSSIILFKQK